MSDLSIVLDLEDEAATNRFGEDLALALKPGDLVWLEGNLGAGKSALARATIRSACKNPGLEVPSPTFTLVQAYDGKAPHGQIAHYDLYRLENPEELVELGLDEALDRGSALVEWPEKGGGFLPRPDLKISLGITGETRRNCTISGTAAAMARIKRSLAIRNFLDQNWDTGVRRCYLLGDASTRAYETAHLGDQGRILMNAPKAPDGPIIRDGKPYSQIAHLAEDVRPFVAIARLLRENGFRAPLIHGEDLDRGILLIENLGDEGVIDHDRIPVRERYIAAVETLAAIHLCQWSNSVDLDDGSIHIIPRYDRTAMMIEVELLLEWYAPTVNASPLGKAEVEAYLEIWTRLIDALEPAEKSLVLRDYHSPNLIWQPGRTDTDRIGLIDFQDAMIGPAAYDVASLGQDARVTVSPELEAQLLDAYLAARKKADAGFDADGFLQTYMIMTAQRGMKLLGLFIRLDKRDSKPAYLAHIPRLKTYMEHSLKHPILSDLKAWLEKNVGF